jgi:AcrR family transcriptional regulator
MTDRQVAKRRHILQSAGAVFAKQGYEHSSIRDIARQAGVADGTIYNYFANKQDLVEALISELIIGLGKAESEAIGLDEPDSLAMKISQRMAALHDNYEALAAVLPVILGSVELRERFRSGFMNPVLAQLECEIGGVDGKLSARMLMAMVLGFQMLLVLGDEPTRQAWDKPQQLAQFWSEFIRVAAGKQG